MATFLNQSASIADNQLNSFSDTAGVTASVWFRIKDIDSVLIIEPTCMSPTAGAYLR